MRPRDVLRDSIPWAWPLRLCGGFRIGVSTDDAPSPARSIWRSALDSVVPVASSRPVDYSTAARSRRMMWNGCLDFPRSCRRRSL